MLFSTLRDIAVPQDMASMSVQSHLILLNAICQAGQHAPVLCYTYYPHDLQTRVTCVAMNRCMSSSLADGFEFSDYDGTA